MILLGILIAVLALALVGALFALLQANTPGPYGADRANVVDETHPYENYDDDTRFF